TGARNSSASAFRARPRSTSRNTSATFAKDVVFPFVTRGNPMKISNLVAGLAAACVALGVSPAPVHAQTPALKKVTFLTNYTFHGRHSPFFVGLEKGYYRDAGFDIDIQPATGSGFVITAVDSGKADYGMAEAASVVQAAAKGAKVKSFMVFTDIS